MVLLTLNILMRIMFQSKCLCAVYFCVALCKLYFYCNLAYKYIASAHLVYVFCAYIWLSIYIYYVVEMFIMISIILCAKIKFIILLLKFLRSQGYAVNIINLFTLRYYCLFVVFFFFVMRWVTFEPVWLVFLIILLCT